MDTYYDFFKINVLLYYSDGKEKMLFSPTRMKHLFYGLFKHHSLLIAVIWPYLVPVCAFVIFAWFNGSIVLGEYLYYITFFLSFFPRLF